MARTDLSAHGGLGDHALARHVAHQATGHQRPEDLALPGGEQVETPADLLLVGAPLGPGAQQGLALRDVHHLLAVVQTTHHGEHLGQRS